MAITQRPVALFGFSPSLEPIVLNHLDQTLSQAVAEFCLVRRYRVIPQLAVAEFRTGLGIPFGTVS